jgi:hypothetical protein
MDLGIVMPVVLVMAAVTVAGFRDLPSMPLEKNFNCVFRMEQRLIHLLAHSLSPNDTDDSYDSIAGGIAQSGMAWHREAR